jgi:hypothetical protein
MHNEILSEVEDQSATMVVIDRFASCEMRGRIVRFSHRLIIQSYACVHCPVSDKSGLYLGPTAGLL